MTAKLQMANAELMPIPMSPPVLQSIEVGFQTEATQSRRHSVRPASARARDRRSLSRSNRVVRERSRSAVRTSNTSAARKSTVKTKDPRIKFISINTSEYQTFEKLNEDGTYSLEIKLTK